MDPRKAKVLAGIAVVAACLVFLVVNGVQKTSMYYFTVTELDAREPEFVGRRIKLAGKVVPGSITKNQNLDYSFSVWEPLSEGQTHSGQRQVHYKGIVPDTFRDEADVILEGSTDGAGVFHAETMLAKCPSKYESKSYDEMKEMHGERPSTRS